MRVIDDCLKLHGLLCPPEFIPFHETLEKFFKKNFRDEIRRLAMDGTSESSLALPESLKVSTSNMSQYQTSGYEESLARSTSSTSTTKPTPSSLPPLNVGHPAITPGIFTSHPPPSPIAPTPTKQTPLQRHLAHLARHGFGGVASAPGEAGGSDSVSAGSPHNSIVNVGNGNGIHTSNAAQTSGASVAASTIGSMGSLGSLKGRFSRFGSLSFGRRGASSS